MFIIKSNGWNQFTLFCKSRDLSRFTKKGGIFYFINECTIVKHAQNSFSFLKDCIIKNPLHFSKSHAHFKYTQHMQAANKANANVNLCPHSRSQNISSTVALEVKIWSLNNYASNIYFLIHHIPAPFAISEIKQYIIYMSNGTHEREERKKFGFCRFWFRQKELQNKATAVTQ